MNEIVKMYNDHPVRIVQQDGEPWFVAKDVCVTLGLDVRSGARGLAEDEKGLHSMQTPGGEQNVQIINEAGLYRLIFKSRKREAENFKRWVCHDVLPSIRKTGAYAAPGIGVEKLKVLLNGLVEQTKKLIMDNAKFREKIAFLEQFTPHGEYGEPSKVNGDPRWL